MVAKKKVKRAPLRKKKVLKKPKPRIRKPALRRKPATRKRVGRISHFFTALSVAVIETEAPLRKGDRILIEGATTALKQTASSIQINRRSVQLARTGSSVGLKVRDRVRLNDVVYRLG